MEFDDEVTKIIQSAYLEAKNRLHEFLTPEHFLYASTNYPYLKRISTKMNLDIKEMRKKLVEYFSKIPTTSNPEPVTSAAFDDMFDKVRQLKRMLNTSISLGDFLIVIYDNSELYASYYLKSLGIKRLALLNVINQDVKTTKNNPQDDFSNYEKQDEDKPEQGNQKQNYFTNITELARQGSLDPLIGREIEIERALQILCKRSKSNPIFVGPPGVGKTALVYGLAQKIVKKEVPAKLQKYEIMSLDMGILVAGTKWRGDFEERIAKIIKECETKANILLFIDEIHTLMGAGASSGSPLDASNMLKPALSLGKVKVIGTTTLEEYKKYIEVDAAFERRFEKVMINEPSIDQAIEILNGIKKLYEKFHNVIYTPKAIEECVRLSNHFIKDKFLPDKAIDILDEAGANLNIVNMKRKSALVNRQEEDFEKYDELGDLPSNNYGNNYGVGGGKNIETEITATQTIDTDEIEEIVAKIARVPKKSINKDDLDKMKSLDKELKQNIFSQDLAIDSVVSFIKKSKTGFRKEDKNIASFLFVGPTGVGKTELAKQIAKTLDLKLLRFDMSEYQEEYRISNLIGSSVGYVGSERGGLLTESIKNNPHSVLLIDEVEKAHPNIFNLFLQIMDYATLTDNSGKKIDFRNVILIMTSNAGAMDMDKNSIGFTKYSKVDEIDSAVNKIFTPEFRNRLDKVIKFNQLDNETIKNIVKRELGNLEDILAKKDTKIEFDDELIDYISLNGYSKTYGARFLMRTIDEQIIDNILDTVLYKPSDKKLKIKVHLDKDENGKDKIFFKSSLLKLKKE